MMTVTQWVTTPFSQTTQSRSTELNYSIQLTSLRRHSGLERYPQKRLLRTSLLANTTSRVCLEMALRINAHPECKRCWA